MLRCAFLSALALFAVAGPAAAQMQRNFPANALRGELVILQPPDVRLNGQAARLAPGARIHGPDNLLQMSGALVGQRLVVNYTREISGLLLDVWILTPAEQAKRPWPTTEAQAQGLGFRPAGADLEPAMTKKVFVRTFGCQMNEYDSDKMADVLRAAEGYEPTSDVDEADLILFNTCSVREKAQEKVFSDLGRVKHLKAKGVLIGVGGCVASQEGAAIVERAPYVDLVFGPQTLHRLPQMIEACRAERRPQVDISFPEIEKFDHLPPARTEGASAFVSIMEGCSKYCSYCVVPYTRGEEVSRPFDDVLTEVAGLAAQGVREVTLLGQNVNAYRGRMGETSEIADFALLIEYVAEIPGVERIRYTTSHPNEFTQRLIEVYAKVPQLVNHLHLPVQHGSDRILMAMKRGYTAMEYKSTIRKLRAVRPDISLSQRLHRRLPRRDRGRLRAHDEADRRHRLRRLVQLRLQQAPGHAGGRAARRDTAGAQARAAAAAAGGDRGQRAAHQRFARRHGAAHPGRRAVAQEPERADGSHRMQPHRQLRRRAAQRAVRRPDARRRHHRGAAALAARPPGAERRQR